MSDDFDGPLVLTADHLALSILNPDRDVAVHVELGAWRQYVARPLVLRMSPTEARQFAAALLRKADEAEGL